NQPQCHAAQRHLHAVKDDESQNVLPLCAQCEANAKFVCTLSDQVRNDAIEANTCQNERHRGEGIKQDHREAPRRQRVGNHLMHRLLSIDDMLAVLALYDTTNRVKKPCRHSPSISLNAHHYPNSGKAARQLPEWFVKLRLE